MPTGWLRRPRSHPRTVTPRRPLRLLHAGCLLLGLLFMTLWSRSTLEALAFQSESSGQLDAAVRERTSPSHAESKAATASGDGTQAVRRGDVLGRIEIPRLGIKAIVAEGSVLRTPGQAVGHAPKRFIVRARQDVPTAYPEVSPEGTLQ